MMVKQLLNDANNFKRNLFIYDEQLKNYTNPNALINRNHRNKRVNRNLYNGNGYASYNYYEFVNAELMVVNTYNINKSNLISKQNHLSKVNLTICETELRIYYGLAFNTNLIYKKIDYTKEFNDYIKFEDSSRFSGVSLSFSIYESNYGEKLSLRPCNMIKITMPVNKFVDFTIPPYNYLLTNLTVNVFDDNDPFYNNKCEIYNYKNMSIPLNTRRTFFYPNKTITCGDSCVFKFIDPDGNINCDCKNPIIGISENLRQMLTENILSKLPVSNIDIFKCDVIIIIKNYKLNILII